MNTVVWQIMRHAPKHYSGKRKRMAVTKCMGFIMDMEERITIHGLLSMAEVIDEYGASICFAESEEGWFIKWFFELILSGMDKDNLEMLCENTLCSMDTESLSAYLGLLIKTGMMMSIYENAPRYMVWQTLLSCVPPEYRSEIEKSLELGNFEKQGRNRLENQCRGFDITCASSEWNSKYETLMKYADDRSIQNLIQATGRELLASLVLIVPEGQREVWFQNMSKVEILYLERQVEKTIKDFYFGRVTKKNLMEDGDKVLNIMERYFGERFVKE